MNHKPIREHARYAFQADVVDACVDYLRLSRGRHGIAVLPTGTGKSHVSAKIIAKLNSRIVILQPSVELLLQNLSKFEAAGGKASVYCGKLGRYEIGDVVYATLESIYKHGHLFAGKGYKALIDEADDYPAETMTTGRTSMIGRFLLESKITHLLGLTASPTKLIRGELRFITRTPNSLWQDVVHVVQVQHAVEHGLWAPIKYKEFSGGMDYSGLKLNAQGTDFTEASMRHAFLHNGLVDKIAYMANVARHHGRKSLLAFAPTVDLAEQVAAAIPDCEAISGSTPTGKRRELVQAWKHLELPMLANVEIITIGVDNPKLDCIFHGRPTKSWRLWYQMNGRGCRVDPQYIKRNCWSYDFTNNFRDFSRIESIIIENVPGYGWGVFTGEQKRLITGIPKGLENHVVFTIEDCWKLPQLLRKWGFDTSDYLYDGGVDL